MYLQGIYVVCTNNSLFLHKIINMCFKIIKKSIYENLRAYYYLNKDKFFKTQIN